MKEPVSLAVDPQNGNCWVVCTYEHTIFKLRPACSGIVCLHGLCQNPSTPCVDHSTCCWIACAWDKIIIKFDPFGNVIDSIIDNLPGQVYLIAIALDGDYIWVCEIIALVDGFVSKFDIPTKTRLFQLSGFYARWIEIDPITHCVWVANEMNDRVVKISPDGATQIPVYGFNKPCCVSVDPNTHEVWVADRENDRVVKLDTSGNVILTVSGFNSPTAVEVHPEDGTCWVSDAGNHRVVKMSPSGDTLLSVYDFVTPMGLAIDTTTPGVEETTFSKPVFHLYQSTPNPAIHKTIIRFSLNKPAYASLKIYSLSGQLVRTLLNENMKPGIKSIIWDGKDFNGNPAPNGLYFCKLRAGNLKETKKLVLFK